MNTALTNKVVMVTGASGGIGGAVARLMAAEGARVAIHYHRNQPQAERLLAELDGPHGVFGADLRDESKVKRLFQDVQQHLGPVDVLVANAGVWPTEDMPIMEMTLERWNETMSVDLNSVFLCVREFLFRAQANRLTAPNVVVIGSTAGGVGESGHADYATAKSGLMYGFLQSLKNEIPRIAPRGRINAVCPGWTITPMAEKFTGNQASMIRALQTIPLRKFANADDIANAVTFLASNQLAGHITGQTLFVSGGMEGRVLNQPEEIDLDSAL